LEKAWKERCNPAETPAALKLQKTRESGFKLLGQIVHNIVQHPSEARYRRLNATKVLPKLGALNQARLILNKLGFETDPSNGDYLHLPSSADLKPLKTTHAQISVWYQALEPAPLWRCEACTFDENMMISFSCSMCQSPRNDKSTEQVLDMLPRYGATSATPMLCKLLVESISAGRATSEMFSSMSYAGVAEVMLLSSAVSVNKDGYADRLLMLSHSLCQHAVSALPAPPVLSSSGGSSMVYTPMFFKKVGGICEMTKKFWRVEKWDGILWG